MRKFISTELIFLLFGPLLIVCGCHSSDREFVSEFNYEYYMKGKNTPAEFMVNSIGSGQNRNDILLLRGDKTGDRKQARANIKELKKNIASGYNWPEKHPREVKIPYSADFKPALVFHGEYALDHIDKTRQDSLWKICWDKKYLHFQAALHDANIYSNTKKPWEGDSVEIFIMPERRLKVYREVVIPPNRKFYTAINSNYKWGLFALNIDDIKTKGIIVKTTIKKDVFNVTCSVPWNELPGYFRGNHPKAGEVIHVMLVRTNQTADKKVVHSAVVPLLYGGHNIFGYMKCTLVK